MKESSMKPIVYRVVLKWFTDIFAQKSIKNLYFWSAFCHITTNHSPINIKFVQKLAECECMEQLIHKLESVGMWATHDGILNEMTVKNELKYKTSKKSLLSLKEETNYCDEKRMNVKKKCNCMHGENFKLV